MTYLEHPAPGVSPDSWPMEGALCLKPLKQSVLSSSIAARPVEDVVRKVSDRKPVINPVTDVNSEKLRMKVSPDPVPLEQSVLRASPELYYEQSYTDVSDDMNTDLPESLPSMLKPLTAFEWPCVNSPILLTAKPEVVNQTKDSFDMNTNLPESSAPMIDSGGYCRCLGYVGGVSHDLLKTDPKSEPEVGNRRKTADLIYMGRKATRANDGWIRTIIQILTPLWSWSMKHGMTHAHGNFAMR